MSSNLYFYSVDIFMFIFIFMGSKAEHQGMQIVVRADGDDEGDVGVTNDAAIRALTARRAPTTGMKLA